MGVGTVWQGLPSSAPSVPSGAPGPALAPRRGFESSCKWRGPVGVGQGQGHHDSQFNHSFIHSFTHSALTEHPCLGVHGQAHVSLHSHLLYAWHS